MKPSGNVLKALNSLVELESRKKEIDSKYIKAKEKYVATIKKHLDDIGENELLFENKNALSSSTCKCTLIEPKSVVYDVDKTIKAISKVSGKRVLDKVVSVKYNIIDGKSLVTYLRSLGASAGEVKKLMSSSRSINAKELEQMYELGLITLNDLKGCYSVKTTKPYLKFTNK